MFVHSFVHSFIHSFSFKHQTMSPRLKERHVCLGRMQSWRDWGCSGKPKRENSLDWRAWTCCAFSRDSFPTCVFESAVSRPDRSRVRVILALIHRSPPSVSKRTCKESSCSFAQPRRRVLHSNKTDKVIRLRTGRPLPSATFEFFNVNF